MPAYPDTTRRVIVLGSTGSIGAQTIDVIEHLNEERRAGRYPIRHEIVGLAAGNNAQALFEQAARSGVRDLALAGEASDTPPGVKVRVGPDAAERLVREVDADLVVAAMVGAAGLPATLAAIELRRDVALANKETLVAAGELVVPSAVRAGVRLYPIDSEHSAMWQSLPDAVCPPCDLGAEVARIIITASGGPFRSWPRERIDNATPDEALAHPTWSMGAKITIDSASLTNKALEIIETRWLFGVPGERIDVLVHPQSIVHSFVEYADGSVVAQLGAPDMRTPIQYALTWPARPAGISHRLNFAEMGRLDFEPPDFDRFPALRLAYAVIERGGAAGAVFNAANEAAVAAFLNRRIPFGMITALAAGALEELAPRPAPPMRTLSGVLEADREARAFVDLAIESRRPGPAVAVPRTPLPQGTRNA